MGATSDVLNRARANRAAQRAAQGEGGSKGLRPSVTAPIWTMPDQLPVAFQFVDNPLNAEEIYIYRELYCSEFAHVSGLWQSGPLMGRSRDEIPFGFRDVVIEDVEFVGSGESVMPVYKYRDMVSIAGRQMDVLEELLDLSSTRFGVDDNGNPKVSWMALVNVVIHDWTDSLRKDGQPRKHPEVGDHILLKFREGDWRKLRDHMVTLADSDVDVMNSVFSVEMIKGSVGGGGRTVKIKRLKLTPEPIYVEAYSAKQQTDTIRQEFLALAEAAVNDMIGIPVPHPADVVEDAPEPPAEAATYDQYDTPTLRKLLADAGVEVPARASRPRLLEMARTHL